jgi:dihydropteroate synthase
MKFNAHLSAARNDAEARERISAVLADEGGVAAMTPKMRHYNIKLEAVPAPAANILKRRMLAGGGEAAISAGAYAGKSDQTDVIMMGTADQYLALSKNLREQPFGLSEMADELPRFLTDIEKKEFEIPTPRGVLELGNKPVLMGIINCTPDSFYDGGRHFGAEKAVERAKRLIDDGADIIDVGGESTRPGSDPVSEDEELNRVIPVVEKLASQKGVMISIDTRKPGVARRAVETGAAVINDVSALADPEMAKVAAETGAALVLMHMKGTPRTMQKDPKYDDLFAEIIAYLRERMDWAVNGGVSEDKIIVDPGIGFGKSAAHNLELIRDLWRLRSLGRPLLLGHSNKRYIGAVLDVGPDDRFEGTAASLVAGIIAGAHIVRVHDVAGMKRFADMAWAIMAV